MNRIRQDRKAASERIRPMLVHLEHHLFDPDLNVNQLKKACGIRDNSIVILFHAEVGHTPKAYLTSRRLETAARMLRETDLKIWQISDLVGYSSLGVFSKAFHRWANLRPKFYRQQERIHRHHPHSSREPSSLQVYDEDFLERTLNGTLDDWEAQRLILRLCEIYDIEPET